MLNKLAGPLRVNEYGRWASRALDLGRELRDDIATLNQVRHALLPLPYLDREVPLDVDLFPPLRSLEVAPLAGKKIGIVATGGSGATICALGVMRACQEAGLEVAAISSCSGSALFLAPIAAGMNAQEAAEFVLGWQADDYVDPEWQQLLKIPLALGRGFTGLVKAEAIERTFHQRFGGVLVRDLPIPFYANVWDLDHSRLHYMGTRTTPDMRLARLVRAAVTLPVYMQPQEIHGNLCGDGGEVNIFPVEPLVRHHPEIDFFIGINACCPPYFQGQDLSGWDQQAFGLLRLSLRPRPGPQLEVARMQLRIIQDRCLLLHPLPEGETRGVRFYEQYLDRSRWPEFIIRGYYDARRNLALLDRSQRLPAPAAD